MTEPLKPIVLSFHAQEQCRYRGTNESEIANVIQTSEWKPSEMGRLECQKDFPFKQLWNGHPYATKRVRPIFAEESDCLVVVTVYVYYF